jgi:tetratricopeptide (TPR) repeat protein
MMVGYALTGYMGLADYPRARAHFEASLEIARKADLQWHMGPTLLGLDHLRACAGDYAEALAGMTRTLRWLESLKQIRYQLIAYDLISHLLLDSGAAQDAAAWCRRGLELARGARVTFWCPRIEANLAIARCALASSRSASSSSALRITVAGTASATSSRAAWRGWRSSRSRAAMLRCASLIRRSSLRSPSRRAWKSSPPRRGAGAAKRCSRTGASTKEGQSSSSRRAPRRT